MVINPSNLWVDITFERDFNLKTVPVDTTAFVSLRRVGQCLRRFKSEIFGQSCSHGRKNTSSSRLRTGVWQTKRLTHEGLAPGSLGRD